MVPVGGDIKVGFKVWKYYGVVRDLWQQVSAAPQQIQELQQRVADLEKRLERCPTEGCPRCGALEYRVETIEPSGFGERKVHLKCQACGLTDSYHLARDQARRLG